MDRADLVYKLVEELEPVLEQYASSGIEVAVLISKVNDNVIGYQGTKLGKEFLEKQTHYTEAFRKFCRDYWYGTENVISNSPVKKAEEESQDITFLSSNDTGAVLSGIDSITLLDGTKFPLSNWLSEAEESGSSPIYVVKNIPSDAKTLIEEDDVPKKKITRKAKFRCQICTDAFFRREHRRNIHMHECHSMEFTEDELAAYPLPENYTKRVVDSSQLTSVDGIGSPSVIKGKKTEPVYKYRCEECNMSFKKMERFNEHRDKVHKLNAVDEDYGKNGYQCEYCPKVFSSRWNLLRHVAIHLGQRKFKCEECDRAFFRKEELKKHELQHKNPQERKSHGKIQCVSCGIPMRVKPGKNCKIPWCHSGRERVRPVYQCKTCDKSFDDTEVEMYKRHVLEHGRDVMSEHDYNGIPSPNESSMVDENEESVDGVIGKTDEENKDNSGKETQEKNAVEFPISEKVDSSADECQDDIVQDKSQVETTLQRGDNSESLKADTTGLKDTNPNSQESDTSAQTENSLNQKEEGTIGQNKNMKMENIKVTPKVIKINENWTSERKRYQKTKYEGAFECQICNKNFATNFILKRHTLIHSGSKKLDCDICGNSFTRKDLLNRHMKKRHRNTSQKSKKGAKRTEIKLEKKTSSDEEDVMEDALEEEEKKVTKDKKEKLSDSEPKVETPKKGRNKRSSCVGCEDDCEINAKTKKREEDIELGIQFEGFVYSISDKSHENYNCKKCDKKFRYRSEYASHQLIHNSKKKVFPCAMCTLVFLTPVNLMKHQQKHDKNGNFSCEICTFLTDSLEHLTRHRGIHKQDKEKKPAVTNDTKPSICDQCGKKCTNPHRLKQHLLTHSGEKPYQCKQCEKSFHTLDILKNHKNTHLDVKPFMCDDCGKTFHQASTLATHKLVHGLPKITCEICSTKFRNMAGLKSHMIARHSNTPNARNMNANILKCDICDKSFFRKRDLDRHVRTHTSEKPFICHFRNCGKAFADRSNCKAHEKSHSQNKFKCSQCEKGYSYKHDLKKHILKNHPLEDEEAYNNVISKITVDVEQNSSMNDINDQSESLKESGNNESQESQDSDIQMIDVCGSEESQEDDNETTTHHKAGENDDLRSDEKHESCSKISKQTSVSVKKIVKIDKLNDGGSNSNNHQLVLEKNGTCVGDNRTDTSVKESNVDGSVVAETHVTNTSVVVASNVADNSCNDFADSCVEDLNVVGAGLPVRAESGVAASDVTVENTMTLGMSSHDGSNELETQTEMPLESVVLQTDDGENGTSTIYVVHSESEEQPQLIYVVQSK